MAVVVAFCLIGAVKADNDLGLEDFQLIPNTSIFVPAATWYQKLDLRLSVIETKLANLEKEKVKNILMGAACNCGPNCPMGANCNCNGACGVVGCSAANMFKVQTIKATDGKGDWQLDPVTGTYFRYRPDLAPSMSSCANGSCGVSGASSSCSGGSCGSSVGSFGRLFGR